jgi:SAM-dependent methyltransferase
LIDQQSTASLRQESYGQHGVTVVDRFGVWLSRRAILRHLPAGQTPDAIDLGCGYHATLLRAIAPRLRSGVGVDLQISPEARAADERLRFIEGSLESVLPGIPDGQFDLVLLISVLEHLWNPQSALEHCRRILRPGGRLLLNVPTWTGKIFLEFSAFRLGMSPALEMDDHKMYYSKRDLWPLLVRAGFKPSRLRLRYHKFGLNLYALAQREPENVRA